MPSGLNSTPILAKLQIKDLFGYKNYSLEFTEHIPTNAAFLYGDNGSGKSTILNLIYSLLSRNTSEGNRSYLARTPFRSITATLMDGTKIEVTKNKGLVGPFRLVAESEINRVDAQVAVDEEGAVVASQNKEFVRDYHVFLDALEINFIYVTDSREIKTTLPILRKILRLEDNNEENDDDEILWRPSTVRYRQFDTDRKPTLDVNAVTDALKEWIRSKAFQDSTFGQYTADNIYLELAQQIASPQLFDISKGIRKGDLIQKVETLETALRSPIKYNLMPAIKFEQLRDAINKCSEEQLDILFAIIGPYLDTLSAIPSRLRGGV